MASLLVGVGSARETPYPPIFFTLVMEVFVGILTSRSFMPEFRYFWRCRATTLSYLFFVDDVFLFCEADLPSVKLFKEGLQIFSKWFWPLPEHKQK